MAKKNSKRPIDINVKDPIYTVYERKDAETGQKLFDVKSQIVINVGFPNDDENSDEIVVNRKWNLPLTNKPGVKKLDEVIIDEEQALETVLHYIKEEEIEARKKRDFAQKCLDMVEQNRKIFEGRTTLEKPKGMKSDTTYLDLREDGGKPEGTIVIPGEKEREEDESYI